MRALIALLLSLWLAPSWAQLPMTGAGKGTSAVAASFTAGPSSPPSSNIVNLAFANTTQTFTGINGGVNFPANSTVIVGLASDLTTGPTTPQIGGQTATEIANTGNRVRLFQATMPGTAQSDTFSFATGGSFRNTGVLLVGYFTNLQSSTASATGNQASFGTSGATQTLASAITVPSDPAWGVIFLYNVVSPTSITWANTTSGSGDGFLSLNPGGAGGAQVTMGFAHTATAGSWNPSATGVGSSLAFGTGLVAATWH